MKKFNKNYLYISILLFSFFTAFLLISTKNSNKEDVKGLSTISFETEPTIAINPELNISRFAQYILSAQNIPDTPNSVFMEIWGLNGNDPSETCWDYYVDGTCGSKNIVTQMSKIGSEWKTGNIYPDSIYPEIYFANSDITWENTPLSKPIRRNEYHIMHFNNPFRMVNDMSFFIEFDAYPNSTVNSADLQIYLVSKEAEITDFNESWFNKDNVELVGTFNKNSPYHHTHSPNSSHRLVPLSTNIDGTIGSKSIDVSESFWIVLYSQSPNNARGWNLQYHPSPLCNHENRWYTGDFQGWNTTEQEGCPNSHIHIARRNPEYMDGIEVQINATYDSYQAVSEPTKFYFGELPNLPPSSTSFVKPSIGGTYSESLHIQWEAATDPNNDPLYYNIYLKQNDLIVESFTNLTNTEISIADTTSLENGNYTISGEICDSQNPCVPFALGGEFTIENVLPIQSLNNISLESSNTNPLYAKVGDTITLSFEATGTISSPTVEIYSGGDEPKGEIIPENSDFLWSYTYSVTEEDTNGAVSFSIISTTLDREYYETTNSSKIRIDTIAPPSPSSSLDSGSYRSNMTNTTTLTSDGAEVIRYTITNDPLSCTQGLIYLSPIQITSDTTIKAISCDKAGNMSEISTFEYLILEDLTSISISSSNINNEWAKENDTIFISFESSDTISTPTINLYANEKPLLNTPIIKNDFENIWTIEYVVLQDDPNGAVSFEISSDRLYTIFEETTDSTIVNIDTIPPIQPIPSEPSGIYNSPILISLTSLGHQYLRYTLDKTDPSCQNGSIYLSPISINKTQTLKIIACDASGNKSPIATHIYFFQYTQINIIEEKSDEPPKSEQIQEVETEILTNTPEANSKTTETKDVEIIDESNDTEVKKSNNYEAESIRRGPSVYISELRVQILDQEKRPVPNILVKLFSEPQEEYTDKNGIAIFKEVKAGKHTISLTYNGKTYEKEINIDKPDLNEEVIILEITEIIVSEPNNSKYLYLLLIIPLFWLIYKKRQAKKSDS